MDYCENCERSICCNCSALSWCQGTGTCIECFDSKFICSGCNGYVKVKLPFCVDSGEKFLCYKCNEEYCIDVEGFE